MVDVESLATFARIAAPTGAEDARLDWLERRLRDAPGRRARDAAGNLVWRFGETPPALLVMAHVDTVFDATTPLTIERDGDALVGPGVGDNAAAVMTVIWALEAVPRPPGGLAVAFTVGEEGLGNLRGARHVCRELAPEAAVAVEGHGLDNVITDHVGSVRARVSVHGPGGHSWWDRGTPSALHALIEIAHGLTAQGVNIGRLSGGGAVNAIAADAQLLAEVRSLDDADLTAFEHTLAALDVGAPLSLHCEVVGRRGAGRIAVEHPLVQSTLDIRRALGLPERCASGSTDANAAAALGIPAIAVGCANGSGMHTLQERIDLPSLQLGRRQLAAIVRGF
jgi:acetylornithine deacetylase/succinyl-diaminopimelate desuccinylase-like protein